MEGGWGTTAWGRNAEQWGEHLGIIKARRQKAEEDLLLPWWCEGDGHLAKKEDMASIAMEKVRYEGRIE